MNTIFNAYDYIYRQIDNYYYGENTYLSDYLFISEPNGENNLNNEIVKNYNLLLLANINK